MSTLEVERRLGPWFATWEVEFSYRRYDEKWVIEVEGARLVGLSDRSSVQHGESPKWDAKSSSSKSWFRTWEAIDAENYCDVIESDATIDAIGRYLDQD